MRRRPLLALVGTATVAGCTGIWSDGDDVDLDELEMLLADREARIDELEAKLEAERGEVDQLESDLHELEAKLEEYRGLEARVDELEAELDDREELDPAERELLQELYAFGETLLTAAQDDIYAADAAIDAEDWVAVFMALNDAGARLDLSALAFERLESIVAAIGDEPLSIVETTTELVRGARIVLEAAINDAAAAASTEDADAIDRLESDDGYRSFKQAMPDEIDTAHTFAAALEG